MRGWRVLVWTAVAFVITLLIVSFFPSENNGWRKTRTTNTLELISKTISAMERIIDHLFEAGSIINVDGIFGVRMAGDQLSALIQQVEHRGIPKVQKSDLNKLLQRFRIFTQNADKFRQQFRPLAQKTHPTEYAILEHLLIGGAWDMWFPARNIDKKDVPAYGYEKMFSEKIDPETSDSCLKQAYVNQCNFTEKCWIHLTTPDFHGYSLTHEVLFILSTMANRCTKQAEVAALLWKRTPMDKLYAKECAAILREAELISENGYRLFHHDLFMEQIAFCGILGYRDFFRNEWLTKILSWQNELGCFAMDRTASENEFDRHFPHFKEQQRRHTGNEEMLGEQKSSSIFPEKSKLQRRRRHRQKRYEQTLPDGCSSHMTGVAIVALGQFVRFLLEPLLGDEI